MLSKTVVFVALVLASAQQAVAARHQVDIAALRQRIRREMEPGYRAARVKRQSNAVQTVTITQTANGSTQTITQTQTQTNTQSSSASGTATSSSASATATVNPSALECGAFSYTTDAGLQGVFTVRTGQAAGSNNRQVYGSSSAILSNQVQISATALMSAQSINGVSRYALRVDIPQFPGGTSFVIASTTALGTAGTPAQFAGNAVQVRTSLSSTPNAAQYQYLIGPDNIVTVPGRVFLINTGVPGAVNLQLNPANGANAGAITTAPTDPTTGQFDTTTVGTGVVPIDVTCIPF